MNTNLRTETEQVIFQSGAGGYREYRIPGILPLKDGALLLACESRAENKGDGVVKHPVAVLNLSVYRAVSSEP